MTAQSRQPTRLELIDLAVQTAMITSRAAFDQSSEKVQERILRHIATVAAKMVWLDAPKVTQRPDNAMLMARLFRNRIAAGVKVAAIVIEFGLASESLVRQRLQLLKLIPEAQDMVERGLLSAIQGWGIAIAPAAAQALLIAQIRSGELKTTDQIKAAGRVLRDAA